jgi:hypothetical protein
MKYVLGLLLLAGCSEGGRSVRGGLDDLGGASGDLAGVTFDLAEIPLASGDGGVVDVNRIYAHTGDTLYIVDPVSFNLTTVGKFTLSGPGTLESMTDLAVAPSGEVYTISKTSLYKVNPTDAKATRLLSNITTSNVALTFQTDGTLLATDQAGAVRVIDPSTGNVKEIGSYGSGFNSAGDLVAVSDGTMFGISATGPGSTSTSNVLIIVDPQTGKATGVGPIGFDNVFGLAYSNGQVIAFTSSGQIITIDHTTGKGKLVKTISNHAFYGAGTSPLVPIS